MFIPGTHDTLADNGGDLAECQGWSVKQQLESGLRVLDLRFKHDGDKMCAYHGIINLHKDVITEIK
jgi:1-phosphatidylinositol phosphodiesterase